MYDVIVVGGGLIGSSITYFLSKGGKKVIQLECKDLAAGASGSCVQMNLIQSKPANDSLLIALQTVKLYRQLAKELVYDIEYNEKGGMILIENELEYPLIESLMKSQKKMGLEVDMLDLKEVKKIQSGISDSIVAATYCPLDHEINPFKVILGFTRTAKKYGAEIRVHEPVTDIIVKNSKVKGVKTPKGNIYGDIVINAAGAWAPKIGEMVDMQIPITPCRGQVFITEAIAPYIIKCALNASYIVGKSNPETMVGAPSVVIEKAIGFCVTQINKGNLIFGSTREFVGYDISTSYDALQAIAKNSIKVFPGLKNLKIIRTFSGLRPNTSDGKPLVGFTDGLEGFFIAAGHGGDGTVAAPTAGKMVADIILNGKSDLPLVDAYNPNRFELFN